MKALVSTLIACCPFLDVLSCLPAPCCHFCFCLLLLPYLPDPELHPLAMATHAVFNVLLVCVLLDQSPSQTQSYS